jgi:hypothetical protein
LEAKELRLIDAATTAGAQGYYNTYYRLYCRFTHAAFSAVTGSLDDTQPEDNETMAASTFCGLDTVASLGGQAPNLSSLGTRLFSLNKTTGSKSTT